MMWQLDRSRLLPPGPIVRGVPSFMVLVPWRIACLCLALCAQVVMAGDEQEAGAGSLPELAAIAAYSDDAYIGGIDSRGVALARALSERLRRVLPGQDEPCDAPDLFAGELVQSGDDAKVAEMPAPLADVQVAIERGSDEQRAVLMLAMSWTGTKARPLSGGFGRRRNYRDPWEVVALEEVICDQLSGGELDALLPKPSFQEVSPVDVDAPREPRFEWLLAHALDVDRVWPHTLIGGTEDYFRVDRDAGIILDPTVARRITAMLASPVPDPKYKTAWLHLLSRRAQRLELLVDDLQELAVAGDDALAWAAQRVLVASDTEAGARQFALWMSKDVLHPAWPDTPTLAQRFPDVLIPALRRTLQSPIWSNRAAAVEVLGDTGTARATPIVVSAVRSVDWPSAMAAAGALTRLQQHDPAARAQLEDLAATYWSGRVRAAARIGLASGKPAGRDPFACEGPSESSVAIPAEANQDDDLACQISICGGCPVEHKQTICGGPDGPSDGRYRVDGHVLGRVRWVRPRRAEIPRITIAEVSPWCETVGSTTTLRVEGGWLAGCTGFEQGGGMVFVPNNGPASPVEVGHIGVVAIARVGQRIVAAGSMPFDFRDAGALVEVIRGADGTWSTRPLAALPSVPDGHAVLGDRIAFRDRRNAVLYDFAGEILPIEPAFECDSPGP